MVTPVKGAQLYQPRTARCIARRTVSLRLRLPDLQSRAMLQHGEYVTVPVCRQRIQEKVDQTTTCREVPRSSALALAACRWRRI
jgi:hypothetical protein